MRTPAEDARMMERHYLREIARLRDRLHRLREQLREILTESHR